MRSLYNQEAAMEFSALDWEKLKEPLSRNELGLGVNTRTDYAKCFPTSCRSGGFSPLILLFCLVFFDLLFVQVFAGHVVFGHFTRANFLSFAFSGILNPRHYPSLERVPFFKQLINTFRIRTFDVGQTLQVSGLFARARSRSLAGERR